MYVITFDRHVGDDINSHHEYGVFDVDNNKRIYGKHQQYSDSKRTATTTTSNNNKWRRSKEQMTFNKLSSSLTRTAPVLSLLLVATILFAGPLVTVQQTAATTTTLTPEEQDIEETQDIATENLTEEDRDVNGIEFTPRWGGISTIEPDSIDVLFADCQEDEFAVSGQFIFETSDIVPSQSLAYGLPGDSMTWVAVVENTHGTEERAASIGVICASENDGDDDDDYVLDVRTKTTIKNIIKQIINIENNQVVNLNEITNIYQQIIQNAIQIATITGNNNTVNQLINQSASQILNQNATSPTEIQQIIDQEARQEGVIGGGGGAGGNATSLSQLIDQEADQAANVTGEGGPTTIDQAIDQEADQAANVTGEGGPTIFDQLIDQQGEQQAEVDGTDGEAGNSTG